ncbi:TPA: hypothetical protein DIS56_02585 [Candidatus Saccharibacteria bacterium]|nr:MAG: hypothetical protein UX30_C0003G0122 [Candidatus Saccharibacteria bacterium GW2011_GWA2_46_10]OGL36305.1 MAG: hypothetical protein A3F05_03265 [Candidatus Saccharibacteria bacterium RIFCSPHIGHO2_12_FULL_47_17]HCM51997.1 hypothetical protein [Candidatus Saccharibacteria bacterium]
MKAKFDFKKLNLDRGQTRMLVMITAAVAVSVFCLLSAKALWSQAAYHRQVLSAKKEAVKQLKSNLDTIETLKTQYDSFNSANPNAIGGKNVADANAAPPDGENGRIVLNALPAKYDFPALISSVTKIMTINRIGNPGIAGSDQSATISSQPTANPQAVEIPLSLSGLTTYSGAQNLVRDLERSIRPFDITKLQLSGSSASLSVSASVTTYFQPAKILSSGTKEVK